LDYWSQLGFAIMHVEIGSIFPTLWRRTLRFAWDWSNMRFCMFSLWENGWKIMHRQSLTFLFPSEIESVPLFCWSWSPIIGFTIFCCGRSSMTYLQILKPYKFYALLRVYIYRAGTWMHWFFILVKIHLAVHLSKVRLSLYI
jgi:hypothetical protein